MMMWIGQKKKNSLPISNFYKKRKKLQKNNFKKNETLKKLKKLELVKKIR